MKTALKLFTIISFLIANQNVFAQKTIKEYVTKNSAEKIKKKIVMIGQPVKSSPKSFKDGHSKWPLITSREQLPDTIALITFNISDLGITTYWKNDYYSFTEYFSVSETGGNTIANEMQKQTISTLKEEFEKQGVVLLTPSEFLNTQEKKSFYYDEFAPTVSKVGTFLSNIENRATDIAVCADYYRYFDMGAAFDHLRSESLGYDLAKKLGVDGVLSIGIVIQSNKKEAYVRAIKMGIHGPNPIAKLDKKYVGQKTGVGYYNGQLYAGGQIQFKKPFKSVELGKTEVTSMDFDGLEIIFKNFIEKFYEEIDISIARVTK